jgi:uncharacterized membrane protein
MTLIQKRDLARGLTLASLLTIVLLMMVATLSGTHANTPPIAAYLFVIAIKTLPLLCFLPGLLRYRAATGVWLALLLLPFFCLAVLYAFDSGQAGLLGLLQALLIAFCFWSALLFTRWQRAVDAQA